LYFSDDPSVLNNAAHKYEVSINAKSPLTLEMPDFRTRKVDVVSQHFGIDPPTLKTDFPAWSEHVTNRAKQAGHDAIVLDNSPTGYNGKEIAVFDDALVQILKKYGWVPGMAIPAAAMMEYSGEGRLPMVDDAQGLTEGSTVPAGPARDTKEARRRYWAMIVRSEKEFRLWPPTLQKDHWHLP